MYRQPQQQFQRPPSNWRANYASKSGRSLASTVRSDADAGARATTKSKSPPDADADADGSTSPADVEAYGKHGFGLSNKKHMDLLIIMGLACIGVFIKFGLQEPPTRLGNAGPASSTIWAYGLIAICISIMVFMGIYHSQKMDYSDKTNIGKILLNTFPIIATLFIVIYTMYLNFSFFTRINSNKVTEEYRTYVNFSSSFLLFQILFISGYLFFFISAKHKSEDNKYKTRTEMYKSVSYILCFINAIFLLMMHINLAFFSTDEIIS
jgi:hypothetical protein